MLDEKRFVPSAPLKKGQILRGCCAMVTSNGSRQMHLERGKIWYYSIHQNKDFSGGILWSDHFHRFGMILETQFGSALAASWSLSLCP
jgi:hypothetical protein